MIIISPHENNNYNASIQIPGESGLVYKAQLDATDGIEIVAVKTVKGMVVSIYKDYCCREYILYTFIYMNLHVLYNNYILIFVDTIYLTHAVLLFVGNIK